MNYIKYFITSLLLVIIIVPIVRKISFKIGAIDKPNQRRVNNIDMPSMGGLAIFITFIICHFLYMDFSKDINAILFGSILIISIGVIDDIYNIKPKYKLIIQIIAASIIIFYGGLYLEGINIPFLGYIKLYWIGYIITYFWIIGITNSINLIDGLDGLASGVSFITLATMFFLAFIKNDTIVILYCLILGGSTLGFLFYNFHPAKIFMGDTGALFLGFIISVLSLMGFKNATFISLVVPILILGVPVFDTFFAIIRRKLRGQSFAQPDKEHLHHLLMTTNNSQRKTVIIIYGISVVFSFIALFYSVVSAHIGIILLLVCFVIIEYLAINIGLIDKKYFPILKYIIISLNSSSKKSKDKVIYSTITKAKKHK